MTHAIAPPQTPLRDPVCGMEITPSDAVVTRTRGTQTYYFCSEVCVERFDAVAPPIAPASASTGHIELPIKGLTRSSGPALQRALETTPGISHATVNPGDGRARVDYDPARTSPGKLVGAIRTLGLEVGATSVRLKVTGIYYAACTGRIEAVLKAAPGVLDATFNTATEEARVEYLPSAMDQAALLAAVEAAGPYTVQLAPVATESALDKEAIQQASEYRALMRKFWFAAAVGTPTMVLSYPHT